MSSLGSQIEKSELLVKLSVTRDLRILGFLVALPTFLAERSK